MPDLHPAHKHPTTGRSHREESANRQAWQRNKERTLPTNSTRWRKIRANKLARDPLCEDCLEAGRITPANEVDHIDNDSGNNAPDNLASCCKPCHSRRTFGRLRADR